MFDYNLFKKLTAKVISVLQLQESTERFEHTCHELKRLGIKKFEKVDAVFVDDHNTIQELSLKYNIDKTKFRGIDTWFACTLTSLRLWDNLLRNTNDDYFLICEDDITGIQECKFHLEYLINKLNNTWDILYLGSLCPQDIQLCLSDKEIFYSHDILSRNIKLPTDPSFSIIGGWCCVYTRNALEVLIKNCSQLFTNAADAGIIDACRRYNLHFACLNKQLDSFECDDGVFKKDTRDRVSIGVVFQDRKFESLNLKYCRDKNFLKTIYKDTPSHTLSKSSYKPKHLCVIIGESFRSGGNASRTIGSPESVKEQKDAILSHIRFIKNIQFKYNIDIDVAVHTVFTEYTQDIYNIYKDNDINVVSFTHIPNAIGHVNAFRDCLSTQKNIKEYQSIIYLRIDLFLREYIDNIFKPQGDKIVYTWHNNNIIDNLFFSLPKKFFDNINYHINKVWTTQDMRERHKSYCEDSLLLYTQHVSATHRGWNPLFYIVNRHQCLDWMPHAYTDPITRVKTPLNLLTRDEKSNFKNNFDQYHEKLLTYII